MSDCMAEPVPTMKSVVYEVVSCDLTKKSCVNSTEHESFH